MKILLSDDNLIFNKGFTKRYGAKYNIETPDFAAVDFDKAEQVNALFKGKGYDVCIHVIHSGTAEQNIAIDAKSLVCFKNIQYAAILNGVKKLIVITDAKELEGDFDLVDYKEDDNTKLPGGGYALSNHLIKVLAQKDKITTVLQYFDIIGSNYKSDQSPLSKIIAHAFSSSKKAFSVSNDRVVSAVYLDDLFKIVDCFLSLDIEKGIYNIVADEKVSYNEVIKKVKNAAKKYGKEAAFNIEIKNREFEFSAKNDKIKTALPDFKFTPVLSGVNKIFDEKYKPKEEKKPAAKKMVAKKPVQKRRTKNK